ncbi:hypothetical protein CZ774_14180 [Frigoribacterium sp. JB110]|nr:hypothetical protein CZ774_14180 [Frigoribacterium sp. JB110]
MSQNASTRHRTAADARSWFQIDTSVGHRRADVSDVHQK